MSRAKKITVFPHLDTSHQRKADGKCKFSLRVRIQGVPKLYRIGFTENDELYMDAVFWVNETEDGKVLRAKRIKKAKGNPNAHKLQTNLEAKIKEMKDLVSELSLRKEPLTHAVLKQRWELFNCKTLVAYAQQYIDERKGGEYKDTTYNSYCKIINSIREYDPQIGISEVTAKWLKDYQKWVLNDKPIRKGHKSNPRIVRYGQLPTSVPRHMEFFGMIIKDAFLEKLIHYDPYQEFCQRKWKLRNKRPPRQFLEKEELLRLHEAYTSGEVKRYTYTDKRGAVRQPGQKYHNVLQQFLASVYSGFRFSDLERLNNEYECTVSKTHITLVMKKTEKQVRVKISKRLRSVMNLDGNGPLFDGKLYSNGTMNSNLKKILELVGIRKKLTWHGSRHTFATVLIQMGVDIKKVSKLMGHESVQTTEIYAHIVDKDLDAAIDQLDTLDGEQSVNSDTEKLQRLVAEMIAENPGVNVPDELAAMLGLNYSNPTKPIQVNPGEFRKVG